MIALHFLNRPAHTLCFAALISTLSACALVGGEELRTVAEVPGTNAHSVRVGEEARTFLLHIPPTRARRLGRSVRYPLVIVLHGSGANGETVRHMSAFDSLADAAHFVVAYPNGTGGPFNLRSDWNAGACCGPAADRKIDDVAFAKALIDSLSASLPIDRNRVYVAGFSDGGRMAYHIACTLGAQVAAVAVVAGSVVDAGCRPSRAVPLVAFHGTSDLDVPYNDSSLATPHVPPVLAAQHLPPSIQFWSTVNGCKGLKERRLAPHVLLSQFDRCAADLALYTIDGGLHAWPGGASDGKEPTREIAATTVAWRFFVMHPLR